MELLDIGCGAGLFLDVVTQRGARALGLDAGRPNTDRLTARGLDVFCGTLEDYVGRDFGRRYENLRQPAAYMGAADGAWHAWEETLDRGAAVKELMLTGLRQIAGVSVRTLRDVLGADALSHYPRIRELEDAGLLASGDNCIRLTHEGLLVADSVIESLVVG